MQAEENGNPSTADCAEEIEPAQALNVVDKEITESWIMDSGCSFHICYHKAWFENLEEASGTVLLGNNQVCKVCGICNIRFGIHDNSVKLLTGVR